MGVPYEFRPPARIGTVRWGEEGSHGQPPGTWSDDGALMLALLDSLLERGFDVEDQGARAVRWMREGAYTPGGRFDIGGTTKAALTRISQGTPAATAGGSGEGDNGNGSLMRILPIALVNPDETDDGTLVAQASAASAVTHAHQRSRITCAIYVLLARNLLAGMQDRAEAVGEAVASFSAVMPDEWLEEFQVVEEYHQYTGGGYVVDSFWSACDALVEASSYAETIERAIGYGNDTDTTACVAGGLAGIHWGVEAIPREWRDGMRGREIVNPLLARLLAAD